MRWSCLIALCGSIVSSVAAPGLIETLDGRKLEGELQITNDFLVIAGTNQEVVRVGVTNLLQATFSSPSASSNVATGQGIGLLGFYFSNTNLEGSAFARLDETIDFDWSIRAPAPGVANDYFSVAWTGEIEAPVTGEFTFAVAADDYAQLWLNNELIVSSGGQGDFQAVTSNPIGLEAGKKHPLKLVYRDRIGNARVQLLWSGPGISRTIIPRQQLFASSVLSNHVANITTNRGLLGMYYTSESGGRTFTRVDPAIDFHWAAGEPAPGFSRSNFNARWTGQILADHTEEYTFYTTTDERVRLWIDNKRLIDRPEQSWLMESKESLPLVAGEKYDIQLEAQSRSGDAVVKLSWSSSSVAKTNVPASHLFPSRPSASGTHIQSGDKIPPGILLRNGGFIAGPVERATGTSIRLAGLLKNNTLSTVNAAIIVCQPLSKTMQDRIVPGRAGVLLARGDFVDGDFESIENGRVRISSILFGLRSFNAKQDVIAVALRDIQATTPKFEVHLRDRTRLQAEGVSFEPGAISVEDRLVGKVRIREEDLDSVKRGSAGLSVRSRP